MSPELTAAANASITCSGLRAACRALSWDGIVEQEMRSVQDSAATAAEVLDFISVSLLFRCSTRPDPPTRFDWLQSPSRQVARPPLGRAPIRCRPRPPQLDACPKIHPSRRADGSARRQNCRFSVPSPASLEHAFVGPVDSPRLTTRTVDFQLAYARALRGATTTFGAIGKRSD